MNREQIINQNINAIFFEPSIKKIQIPIICIGGSEGGRPDNWAEDLAKKGFMVCALGYFACEHRPENLLNIDLQYFVDVIEYIKNKYKCEKVIMIGKSRGAECVLLLGSFFPYLFEKIIALVPSAVVNGAFLYPNQPAWKYKNLDIPYMKGLFQDDFAMTEKMDLELGMQHKLMPYHSNTEQDPLMMIDLRIVRDKMYKNQYENAKIKVEKITSPLLLFSGKDDAVWPSYKYSEEIMQRLDENKSIIKKEHITYDNVGHGFLLDLPKAILHPIGKFWGKLGGGINENREANEDCWKKMVQFILN